MQKASAKIPSQADGDGSVSMQSMVPCLPPMPTQPPQDHPGGDGMPGIRMDGLTYGSVSVKLYPPAMRSVKFYILLLPIVILVVVFLLPWYTNRYSFWLQVYLCGIYPGDMPGSNLSEHYTGKVEYWNSRLQLRYSKELVNGLQEGFTDSYDDQGRRIYHEEWKKGRPWNGFCHFWEDKAWLLEFRNGKIWNGADPCHDLNGNSMLVYYWNGVVVGKEDYCMKNHIPTDSCCFGLDYSPPQKSKVKSPKIRDE